MCMEHRLAGEVPHLYAGLVTCATIVFYIIVSYRVGVARTKTGTPPPQMTGDPFFERVLRVQGNTLEQMAAFLPALWMFSLYVSDLWAGVLGVVWLLGRTWYAYGYYQAVKKRFPGFLIGLFATAILTVGSLTILLRGAFELHGMQ